MAVRLWALLLGSTCWGCAVFAAVAVDGSHQGADGRVRKFQQAQKGEAYSRNIALLASAKPSRCAHDRRQQFETFLHAAKGETERALTDEVTLAEANQWTDELKLRLPAEQAACETQDDSAEESIILVE